jgi:ligand-binding sensor domain-containing protein
MGNGLLRLDAETGEVKAYTQQGSAATDRKINGLSNSYISKISLSPDGCRIYVATTMGVCAMDMETENWLTTFGGINCLNYGTPTRVAREYGGRVYVGTNDGLLSYELKTRKTHLYALESGLADNGISSLEQDKHGNLWISTDHGLCRLDPKSGKANNYFVDNGLQSNEFSDGASYVASDGQLLFGGLGGVTWFKPEQIE